MKQRRKEGRKEGKKERKKERNKERKKERKKEESLSPFHAPATRSFPPKLDESSPHY